MVAAQHMESQVALYLIASLPSPNKRACLFFPLLLIFLKLNIKHVSLLLFFDLTGILTLHTSVSILLLVCCTYKTNAKGQTKLCHINT